MRISAANIDLQQQQSHSSQRKVHEELTVGHVAAGSTFNAENLISGAHIRQQHIEQSGEIGREINSDNKATADNLRALLEKESKGVYSLDQLRNSASDINGDQLLELQPEDRFKIELLKKLYESITGKRFHVAMIEADEVKKNDDQADSSTELSINSETVTQPQQPEFGLSYRYEETVQQTEQLQFAAHGIVHTSDGKQIDINLNLNLQRSSSEHRQLEIRLGAALKDPLVINFAAPSAELTQRTFMFDIDADGREEQIHQLSSNSGYLALDRNDNQQIDAGSELFGALSGDGFRELSVFDDDQNGFIDEGDAIWEQLKIWIQFEDGSQGLVSLADKGIGAIYLGSSNTEWDLAAGQSEQLAGKLRATGFFLTEQGETGTVQQIDLVV